MKEETGSSGGGPLKDVTATPHVGRVRVVMPPAAKRSHDATIRASQLPAPSAPPCAWPAAHACRAIPPPPVWNAPPGNWHPRPRADATHELKTQLQKAKRMKELQLQKANRMKELQLQEQASMEAQQQQEAQHACLASRDAEQLDRERKDKLLLYVLMEDKERQLRNNCVLQPKQPCKPPPFHLLHAKSSRCISVNTDEEEEAALSSKPPSPWPRSYATKGAAISTAVRRTLTDPELQEAFSMEGRKRRHEMERNGTARRARNECGHKTRGRSWAQREASTLRQAEMNDAGSEPEITRDKDFQ